MAKNRRFDDQRNLSVDRNAQEAKEDVKQVAVDAPASRFQKDAQVQDTETATKIDTPASDLTPKKVSYKGSQLKQEVAAATIEKAKGVGGYASSVTPAEAFGLRSIEFSGDGGTILGSAAGTPIMDKNTQGDTRVEKRLSDVNKDINYLASEQPVVEYDNIPPLAESKSTVGYNGNPKNIAARTQKKTGATSAELLYDRSVDFLAKDEFVFTMGQVIQEQGIDSSSYPTKTYEEVTSGSVSGWQLTDFTRTRGNYAPKYIEVTLKKEEGTPAYVAGFAVEEDDFSCNSERYDTVNRSASNHIIDVNAAELARQTIDADAGSPNSEHFNPLGRSTDQPSRTVMYLRDMEASTGATLFTAYKFAQKARGHYLNRTAKDGQDLISPALDALYGHLMAASSSTDIYNQLNGDANRYRGNIFFNTEGLSMGSAAMLPLLFDGPNGYKTKADFVTRPRGLRLPLQTADNNLNPFHVKKEFVAALNSIDAYSTIDRGYDPMSTVEVLDNVRLIYPYSWAQSLSFTRAAYNEDRVYSSKVFRYKYGAGNGNNTYYITVGDPVLNGIAWFCEQHASTLYEVLSPLDEGDGVTWLIPVVHSTMHFSLWDLLVCAAAPYIVYERTNSMKDILDYEQFYKYPFPELIPIKSANPMNAVNYGNPSALQPLEVKQMLPSSACRWTIPELFMKIGSSDTMLPFYFSEDQITFGGSASSPTITLSDPENFSTPVIRSGVRLAYLDDFFSMDVKDQMLCRDILTRIPGNTPGNALGGYVYKYSQDSEGLLVLKGATVTPVQVHSTPRQLGWFMEAFAGECCVDSNETSSNFGLIKVDASNNVTAIGPSDRAIAYRAINGSSFDAISRSTILGPAAVNVSRAQSFTQLWNMKRASSNNKGSTDFDVLLSAYGGISNVNNSGTQVTSVANMATFRPYIGAMYATDDDHNPTNIYDGQFLFSIHRMLWAIIQKLPYVLNPFDACPEIGCIDPFELSYLFNLAGFMSASYHEEVFNRANQKQNLGYGYVSDPFLADSPVFRDAVKYTQVG